jgi:hypothetical protein
MKEYVEFSCNNAVYSIPNRWHLLSKEEFIGVVADADKMASGKIPPIQVQTNHVLRHMGWDPSKIKDDEAWANIYWLSSQITFIFNLVYPDQEALLDSLSPEERERVLKVPPQHIHDLPIARYLRRLEYKYSLDTCFCAQLIPEITVLGRKYKGYTVNTSYGVLTCSLTALQYLEARSLPLDSSTLPLMAAILYFPGQYNSLEAHSLAKEFSSVDIDTLQAIRINFTSVSNFMLTKTEFYLLTVGSSLGSADICTGELESLYNLAAEGLGDVDTIEGINIVKYLTILRKNLIDGVLQLHHNKMSPGDIVKVTGLPIHIVTSITNK